jgi:hypothetical protein
VDGYSLALFAHVVVVVYLLGADLGRAWLARAGGAPGAGSGERLIAARVALGLGTVTNAALVLLLPAGISLAGALGAYRILGPSWLVATWLVAAAWLALSVAADRAATRPGGGRGLEGADMIARFVIGGGHLYDGAIAFAGTSQTVEARWLAAKITIYGLLIIASVPARRAGFKSRRAAAALASSPADTGASEALAAALRRLPAPIVAGWILVLVAAWLGAAKPSW